MKSVFPPRSRPPRAFDLYATVFLTGAGMMTVELVASHLAARLAILGLNAWTGGVLWLMAQNWLLRILSHMTWVFLLPTVVLGTISPMVAKLAIDRCTANIGRARGIHSGAENALEDLAHALELTGDEEGALACYAQLVQLHPRTLLPRNRAAMPLSQHGHVQASLEQWTVSLEIQPDQPDVLTNLNALAYQTGERDRARDYWQRALAPGSLVLQNNLRILGP